IDFAHPPEARRYDQVALEGVRVCQEESGTEARLFFQARELVVYVDSEVTAGDQVIFVAPIACVELLPFRQVVVDRKAPVGLPRGQNADTGGRIVRQARVIGRGNQRKQAGRGRAEARCGNLVARPLLPRSRGDAAGGRRETLRYENRDLVPIAVEI